jgi:hypothetical protein
VRIIAFIEEPRVVRVGLVHLIFAGRTPAATAAHHSWCDAAGAS